MSDRTHPGGRIRPKFGARVLPNGGYPAYAWLMIEYGAAGTWSWNGDRKAVEFETIAAEEIIAVFVSRGFIERRWGKKVSTDNVLQTARDHFDTIIEEAGRLIRIGATRNGEIHLD